MRLLRFAFCLAVLLALSARAEAHPHVWVTTKTELVFADGKLTALKQAWTFDDAFSAFALQGMEKQKDGTYGDDVLKPLAEVNVTSLKEYDYFVKGKTATAKIAFNDPVDYYLTYENETLTLHFTLPLKTPIAAKALTFDIYDPTIFVSFSFAEKDAVSSPGAPAGCTAEAISPTPGSGPSTTLSESFFTNLTAGSDYGAQFADKIKVSCR